MTVQSGVPSLEEASLLPDHVEHSQRWGTIVGTIRAEDPQFLEGRVELVHVSPVVSVAEELAAAAPGDVDGLLGVLCQASVEQVGADDDRCPSLAGVAVDEHLVFAFGAALDDDPVHYLDDVQGCVVVGHLQVLPIQVVVLHAGVHQLLGRVGEARPRDDAVSAVRVLARLLQVDDRRDAFLLELFEDPVLFNQSV